MSTLAACAHPRVKEVPAALTPPPPSSTPEWQQANESLQACLKVKAFAVDNGTSDPGAIGAEVAEVCWPQVLALADINGHRSTQPAASWGLYNRTIDTAGAQGERVVRALRARALKEAQTLR